MTALTDAWQAALAAEHRAGFAYGLIGAQLHGTAQIGLAITCSDAHEQLRESTRAAMTAGHLVPVPPAADYPDLYPVTTAAQALAVALRVEDDCASAWRFLYSVAASSPSTPSTPGASGASGASAAELRTTAQRALTASAVRAMKWRRIIHPNAPTVAFPGLE